MSRELTLHFMGTLDIPDDQSVSEEDLTVVTIENVLTIKSFNDLGFMVGGQNRKLLVMIEAQ